MIDTTIDCSAITSPSAAYLFGQVAADVNAFSKIESVDIIKSLFDIQVETPNAMDITNAIVNSMPAKDQGKIQSLLFSKGVSGVIWRFTTSKLFMIELSKVIDNHGNFLSLTLISRGNDGVTVNVRELVQFNKDRTTFMNRRIRSIDMNTTIYDHLTTLHDDAISKLEEQILAGSKKEEPVKVTVDPAAENAEATTIAQVDTTNGGIIGYGADAPTEEVEPPLYNLSFEGFENIPDGEVLIEGLKAQIAAIFHDADGDVNLLTKEINDMIEKSIPGKLLSYRIIHEKDSSTYGMYAIVATLEDLPLEMIDDPKILAERDENLKYLFDAAEHLTEWCAETVPDHYFLDEFDKTIGAIPDNIRSIFTKKFPELWKKIESQRLDYYNKVIAYENSMREQAEKKRLEQEEQERKLAEQKKLEEERLPPDLEKEMRSMGISDSDIQAVKSGFVTAKEVIKLHEAETESAMTISSEPAPSVIVTDKHIDPLQPKQQYKAEPAEPMETPKYVVSVGIGLKDLIDTIYYSLSKILDEALARNSGDLPLDEDLSKELSEVMEMNLTVRTDYINPNSHAELIDNVTFYVDEVPPVVKDETPSADIHDIEVQNGLLRGLFGVIDPAVTHLQKFMHKHLTDEQNVGYLATGTFPTETTIVWNDKPYDFTFSIIKFKDGRFYRMYLALTDKNLTDQSWLATRDIPDRWIRLGRDIQNQMNVPSFQGRRPR